MPLRQLLLLKLAFAVATAQSPSGQTFNEELEVTLSREVPCTVLTPAEASATTRAYEIENDSDCPKVMVVATSGFKGALRSGDCGGRSTLGFMKQLTGSKRTGFRRQHRFTLCGVDSAEPTNRDLLVPQGTKVRVESSYEAVSGGNGPECGQVAMCLNLEACDTTAISTGPFRSGRSL